MAVAINGFVYFTMVYGHWKPGKWWILSSVVLWMIRCADLRAGVQVAGYPYDSKEMPPMVNFPLFVIRGLPFPVALTVLLQKRHWLIVPVLVVVPRPVRDLKLWSPNYQLQLQLQLQLQRSTWDSNIELDTWQHEASCLPFSHLSAGLPTLLHSLMLW